jgi:hypothetical protein
MTSDAAFKWGAQAGPNGLRPELMTADQRLAEIAAILAAGLTRLRARQSSQISAHLGESSLDCAANQSGHANVLDDGGKN